MNIDPRWDHFHNFRQLSPAGINFIQQFDLLDETVRGQGKFYSTFSASFAETDSNMT